MSMGKGLHTKRNEKVTAYEASRQVALRTVKPFRSTVVSFEAPPGKYAVIPLIN